MLRLVALSDVAPGYTPLSHDLCHDQAFPVQFAIEGAPGAIALNSFLSPRPAPLDNKTRRNDPHRS